MSKMRCFFFLVFANFFIIFAGTAASQPLSIDLDKAFELALENHESIKAAESDVAKAGEGRRQAHRSRSVTLSVEHATARTEYQAQDIGANSFQNIFSAAYPLYTGGLIEGSIAASEHELSSKILSLERAYQDVRLSVAVAFFTMLRTENMAELAGNSVERLGAHVRNVDVQYRNGTVNRADLLRSEVELINARQSMSQAVNEYEVAIKSLNDVMGLPLGTELIFDREMSHAAFPHTLEECIEYALSHHPDIAIADLLKKKAEAGIVIEKSANKPSVTLSASQTLGSAYNWPGLDQDNLQVAIRAEYTFSDGGVTDSKIRGAREDLKKADYNYESARDTVLLNVTKFFLTMEEAGSRIETGATAVGFAQEAYRIALARYREGVGTNIDVLDAQDALNKSSSNHTQALCDYNIAVAQLVNAMGVPAAFEDN
ncbi:MAG: TolC family protein [Synergistaceae bacterium]|nr:TolC family protein [Synergistaceae bacterium]